MEYALSEYVSPISMAAASADRLLREVQDQKSRNPQDRRFDLVDTDCSRLREAIMARAMNGELTSIDDVLALDEQINAERRKRVAAIFARSQRCHAKSDQLKLFRVENRAGRSIKVATLDADCARMFAIYSGHVQEEKNAKVFVYKDEWIERQRQSGSAIWRALKEGVPGVLKEIGSHVVIESRAKVYTPLSPVSVPDSRFGKK